MHLEDSASRSSTFTETPYEIVSVQQVLIDKAAFSACANSLLEQSERVPRSFYLPASEKHPSCRQDLRRSPWATRLHFGAQPHLDAYQTSLRGIATSSGDGSLFVRTVQSIPTAYPYRNEFTMREENDERDPAFLARLSLHRLGGYAIEEELIDGIEIEEHRVTIIQGENRSVFPPKQASTFLLGMLRGRSWFAEPAEPPVEAVKAEEEAEAPRSIAFRELLDDALDSLLAFTKEVSILEDYEKDEDAETVRIDISACSTTLSYGDAMAYLLDCIQHELRALRGE